MGSKVQHGELDSIKAKQGRPSKKSQIEPVNIENTPKRGRGRPRKNNNDDNISTTSTEETKSTIDNIDNIDNIEPFINTIEPEIINTIDNNQIINTVEPEIFNTFDNNEIINTIEPVIITNEPVIITNEPVIITNEPVINTTDNNEPIYNKVQQELKAIANNIFYNKVIITDFFDRDIKFECNNIKDYKEYLKTNEGMVELIGGYEQQIKPVFDIDAYNIDPNINEITSDINLLFPDKVVKFAKRPPREYKEKGIKYSYRAYVQGVRIMSKNLKKLFIEKGLNNNSIYDISIYSKNRVLYLPLTTKKLNLDAPPLIPIDCDVFDCCASYIKEDYEDYDIRFKEDETQINNKSSTNNYNKSSTKNNDDDDEDIEEDTNKYYRLETLLKMLKPARSQNYDSWFNVICCIKNICIKHNITERNQINLIHLFSKLSPDYIELDVDKWISEKYNKLNEKGYLWNYLFNTCIKEDNPEYYENNMIYTYNKQKIIFEKTYFKCKKPIGFIEINNNINDLDDDILRVLSKKEMLILTENLYCNVYEADKKGNKSWVKHPFFPLWLKDPNIKTYDKLLFTPQHLNELDSKKYYNLFNGFKAELLPINKDYESIKPILHHIKRVLCNDNQEYYNWLIQYYAQIIQNPLIKTDTIIIYKGVQGCGKNIFIDFLSKKIIGDDYSISTANPERHLLGNFNSSLLNKVFAVCNEVGNDMRPLIDKLKDLATTPDNLIEKKGKDPISNPNYININMTTNNNNPIDIQADDRRMCWLNCNSCYVGNVEYFNKLADCCNDDLIISSFYHYLKEEIKITISNFQKTRPITKEYQAIKRMNTHNYIKFLIDLEMDEIRKLEYRKYKGELTAIRKITEFYNSYLKWCESYKYTPFNKSQFEERLTADNTGIIKCIYEGNKCLRFNQLKYNEFLSNHQEKPEEIEIISNNNFDDI